jgi:O-antigen ligase
VGLDGPSVTADAGAVRRFDATSFLTVYAILLILVPSNLVVDGLGAAGTPANLFGVFGLLWWVCTWMVGLPRAAGRLQPVRIAIALVGLSVVASFAACALRSVDRIELSAADRGILTMLSWAGPALVAADGIRSLERLHVLLKRVTVIVAILAVTGIVAFMFRYDARNLYQIPGLEVNHDRVGFIKWGDGLVRVAGLAGHPIELGVVLATWLPVAVHYAMAAPRALARKWWICVVLIALGLPMSISRSGVLGVTAAAIVMFLAWSWRLRGRAVVAVVVFLGAMRFVIPGLLGTLKSLFLNLGEDPSVQGRTEDYSIIGRFIAERPWFGRGFQTFIPSRYIFLDNQVTGTIIELGYVGLVAVSAFLLIGFFTARGARRRSRDIEVRHLAQSLAAAVVAASVGFLTFDLFGFAMIAGLLFFLVGCCGAIWRLAAMPPDGIEDLRVRRAAQAGTS